MSSFHHPAGITTLHRFQPVSWPALESALIRLAPHCPITLLLPCHQRELGTPSFALILKELGQAEWIHKIIIGVDGASEEDVQRLRPLLRPLQGKAEVLWTSAPGIAELEQSLQKAGLVTASRGKGRNVWLCAGAALDAADTPGVVAMHDCDIIDYSRELAGRLCYPLMEQRWGFLFNKGFYPRHSDRLHGRMQRLLVRPLLRAMELRAGPVPMLQYLSAFRYPLAGEAAVERTLLERLNFPSSWGLEIGLLEEVRRQLVPGLICQTELCAAYDHRHQDLSRDDPEQGLHRMAREVAGTVLATVSGGTYPWREEIVATWQQLAADSLRQGEAESLLNGLSHHPREELEAVETFGSALQAAVEEPVAPALLPSWEVARRAVPEVLTKLRSTLLTEF